MTFMIFPVTLALVYTVMTGLLYISKRKINNIDNRLYSNLIVYTIISMVTEIILFILTVDDVLTLLDIFVLKMFNIIIISWVILFGVYSFVLTKKGKVSDDGFKTKYKKNFNVLKLSYVLIVFAIIILPISLSNGSMYKYSYGPSVNVVQVVSAVVSFYIIYLLIKNYKNIKNKGYINLILFIVLVLINVIIQSIFPEFLILNLVEGIIINLMYNTIENPDLKLLKELEYAKMQAIKANDAKTDFLSSMSHEIRTPLNAIVGLSDDLRNSSDISKELKADLEDIYTSGQTAVELMGNILDIQKIESDNMVTANVVYDLKDIINKIVKMNNIRFKNKKLDIQVNYAKDLPYLLYGDKVHIKSIINNLVTNAIKYTDEGSVFININCINNKEYSDLIISVQDTGRGIKKENISKLFTKFERLDIEKNSTTEGTGLGLAITKQLVDLLGGKINVESTYGTGSIFQVHLRQKISKETREISDTELINTLKIRNEINLLKSDTKTNVKKKVLVVDDNKMNLKVAIRTIADFNFEIDECYDGDECLEMIKSGKTYDLILMDIMMPNLSGDKALIELKKLEDFNTPVIAVTADAVLGAKEKYLSIGFSDYITKPYTKNEISKVINKILELEIN